MDLLDFPETVRYLTQEDEGRALGKTVAGNSREWSRKILREQDAKLFFWRFDAGVWKTNG
ncbi:hypothetical protein N7474_005883 [Penicillium riverlandense]|uniref:uncharacterized protein n=1 Tax=Penicillium riverlandense TaxID=1903569 RepID=UPI00254783FF|nr:uncharacterized protein N7474_005883 [Penicillium riverlandense]KAJ5820292.1 hypothetical protein N7474_005883 [Penicillium riverlandense]